MPAPLLTPDELLILDDARRVLRALDKPLLTRAIEYDQENPRRGTSDVYWLGRIRECVEQAEHAIFQVMNMLNASGDQKIDEDIVYCRDRDVEPLRNLGTADGAYVESDEDGFHLRLTTDTGVYIANVHAVSHELWDAVEKEIGQYWREGRRAARAHLAPVDGDGYDPDDPKHPTYHDRMSAIHDEREGK